MHIGQVYVQFITGLLTRSFSIKERIALPQDTSAETIALQALTHLVTQEKLLDRFMALTGLTPSDLQNGATDPDFLAGVLDFFLANETDLLDFCEAQNIAPEIPAKARLKLPGAQWLG